jgi:hypothetical protein
LFPYLLNFAICSDMKSDTPATLKSLLNCAQPSPIIGYTARKIANSIISLIIVKL